MSWVRRVRNGDLRLLGVGKFIYTSDARITIEQRKVTDDWLLKIRSVQIKDGGAYECQVSTSPPIRHTIYLKILG